MTYFGFLARFIVLPLLVLRFLHYLDRRGGKAMPPALSSWPEDIVLAGHAGVAVAYTTVWDNYLVASGVWSYDPRLVTGVTLGYVPVEEYTFFVLQSLLTGSWFQYLAKRVPASSAPFNPGQTLPYRLAAVGALGVVWAAGVRRLMESPGRNDYLGLILGWALPPIMFQLGFGGDILWRHRLLVAGGIVPATLYLGLADSLAISDGTWAINSENTVGTEVIKNLPFEELLFFFLTNVLLVFGVTLVLSPESENRLPGWLRPLYVRWKSRVTSG